MYKILYVMSNDELMAWLEKAGKGLPSKSSGRVAEISVAVYLAGGKYYKVHAGLSEADDAGHFVRISLDLTERSTGVSIFARRGNGRRNDFVMHYDMVQEFIQDASDVLGRMQSS